MALWRYYLKKCDRESVSFCLLCSGGRDIGYVILRENTILEVGLEGSSVAEVSNHIGYSLSKNGYSDAVFEIGKNHPLIVYLAKYEHSVSTRYVWVGGHIARVNSVLGFLRKTVKVLELRANRAHSDGFEFSCNSVRFVYRNRSLGIHSSPIEEADIVFHESEWVKLILGVVPLRYLAGLKGDCYQEVLGILFPECSPQFPWIDQF